MAYISASDSTCTQYCQRSALYKLLGAYVCMYVCTVTVATAFGEEVSRM